MPGWKALPEELDPDVRAFTERLRRLVDRSGLGVTAVAERTGHERSAWDTYLNARQSVPRGAAVALAEVTGSDPASLATDWERAERAWARTTAPAGDRGGAGARPAREPEDADGGRPRDPGGDDRTMEIRRLDRPRPEVPLPAPDAPASRTPDSRRRKVLLYATGVIGALLVVTAALLLVDLGGGSEGPGEGHRAAAPPTTTAPPATRPASLPPGVRCAGPDCTGKDPEAMGCGGPLATTVARAAVGAAQVEVRYSETCGAAWARLTGGAPRDALTIRAGDAERRATVAAGTDTATAETDAYTPMVAVAPGTAALACGQLADGSEGCVTGP